MINLINRIKRLSPISAVARASIVVALAASTVVVTGCERKTYEPKPPAATPPASMPSGAVGSSTGASSGTAASSATAPAASPGAPPAASAAPPASPAASSATGAARTLADLGPLSGQNDPGNLLQVGGISAPKPVEWTWVKPTNAFRTLQYAVPAPGGAGTAGELVVSGFVGNDGGPLQQNIDRWVGSFSTEDGQPVTPVLAEKTVAGMKVNLIELRGRFRDMAGAQHPGVLQLGAIVHAPGGRVFLRLYGPEATVEANRAAWDRLIDGLKPSASGG